MADVDEAELLITAHGEPFNREGWEYIVKELNGRLPVVIKAAPEGSIIPTKNVLLTIENTDPKCFWLTTFLETALLRAIWYPTTVATNSYESRKEILKYLEKTGDPALIDFKLHDFGARGVSSKESAGLGGMGHLLSFRGTDTVTALVYARNYYGADIAGYSIPAAEHSTITSWGRDKEVDAYRNMIRQFGREGSIVAVVSDSYDIFNACKLWGTVLKDDVINSGATVVVRPDSGNPPEVVLQCLEILDKYFGNVKNDKGYKVLNNVRVIQGDGIDKQMIRAILYSITLAGYSADNVAFGQGGALLQMVNRDDLKFAMKCSAIKVNGEWRHVFKDPITDQGKKSKSGRVTLYKDKNGYRSGVEDWELPALQEVYRDGELLLEVTWDDVLRNYATK
jgi:nicotinamide phosphoribosyltransferase